MYPYPPPPAPPRRNATWLIVGLVGAVVLVVVLAIAVVLIVRPFARSNDVPAVSYSGTLGVPGQHLLAPMAAQPSPGWRLDLKGLLPGSVTPKAESFVGRIEDTGYFVVADYKGGSGLPEMWVLGVDVTSGTPTFPPVRLSGWGEVTCYLNGPRRVLCLQHAGDDETFDAYVIDSERGAVLSHAPTRLSPFDVRQVGDYAVAVQDDTGAHGIGDQAQLTWSVTGTSVLLSEVDGRYFPGDPPANVAVLTTDGPDRAFSAVDGTVLVQSDGRIEPFVGGVVVQSQPGTNAFDVYDDHGGVVGHYAAPGRHTAVSTGPGQLPEVALDLDGTQVVLDPRGVPMAVLKTTTLRNSRIIGSALFTTTDVNPTGETEWEKFDLKTGQRVSTCRGLPLGQREYIGSDGNVVIGAFGLPNESRTLVAVDTDTCGNAWTIDDLADAWSVGYTLVQSRPATGELVGVA